YILRSAYSAIEYTLPQGIPASEWNFDLTMKDGYLSGTYDPKLILNGNIYEGSDFIVNQVAPLIHEEVIAIAWELFPYMHPAMNSIGKRAIQNYIYVPGQFTPALEAEVCEFTYTIDNDDDQVYTQQFKFDDPDNLTTSESGLA